MSGVMETSIRPLRHPSGHVRGNGCTGLAFWEAHRAEMETWLSACEAWGHMSPGIGAGWKREGPVQRTGFLRLGGPRARTHAYERKGM